MIKKMALLLAMTSFLLVFAVPIQGPNQGHGTISPTGIIGGA